ncbi:MAG: ribosomal RNA small subunit methyltransferase A [Candidatus Margulisbacteria bacterium]|nr:ribosomal RNA small subunit methyltransferase A [Candidatus Margulisiibacteriota bacterium]MBU1617285.1 ribosomal RNA small subunit methyltransferase A [Candidatus Margulisiibacteriota bacterium]
MTPTLAEVTRQLLEVYNRFPRKRLGQHFLIDPQVVARIISAAELGKDDLVVEIGSGLGVVTAELGKAVYHLIAVEIDQELVSISKKILAPLPNISFVPQDILKTDLADLALGRHYKVVGNLPYYITSPIVEKILTASAKPELAVVMTQKEVAERMVAKPGTKNYGSFSIFCQFYAVVELCSLVSKSSFLPWPEVSSAIVKLVPYKTAKYPVKDEHLFFDIVHAAFQQRRKKMRNSLARFEVVNSPVDLDRRPETVSIEEFAAITNAI